MFFCFFFKKENKTGAKTRRCGKLMHIERRKYGTVIKTGETPHSKQHITCFFVNIYRCFCLFTIIKALALL